MEDEPGSLEKVPSTLSSARGDHHQTPVPPAPQKDFAEDGLKDSWLQRHGADGQDCAARQLGAQGLQRL